MCLFFGGFLFFVFLKCARSAFVAIFMLIQKRIFLLFSCQWRRVLKLTFILKKTSCPLLLPLFLPVACNLDADCPFKSLSQSDRDRFPVAHWIICHWFTVSCAKEKRKLFSDFDGSCFVAKLALQ